MNCFKPENIDKTELPVNLFQQIWQSSAPWNSLRCCWVSFPMGIIFFKYWLIVTDVAITWSRNSSAALGPWITCRGWKNLPSDGTMYKQLPQGLSFWYIWVYQVVWSFSHSCTAIGTLSKCPYMTSESVSFCSVLVHWSIEAKIRNWVCNIHRQIIILNKSINDN